MEIEIEWSSLEQNKELWEQKKCVYAYLTADTKEILYVGKSWSTTVRQRWNRSGKEGFWDDLETMRDIYRHCPIIGEIYMEQSRRLTKELLADIESLIIITEQPWGNIQSKKTRISRPRMTVTCSGLWPGDEIYYDI